MNRRQFIARGTSAGLVGLAAAAPSGYAAAGPTHTIRFGGPVFSDATDPETLARAHRKLGYSAAYCPEVALNDAARIQAFADAFAAQNITIAEVGRWVNLMDADTARRAENLRKVTEGLALADAIGALCCVDIAGSRSPEQWYGPHPENLSDEFFELAVENARKIIDAVKPRRAKFCYEMMGWALPDSADSCLRLLKAIERRAFGVHLDPCNLINSPSRFYRNTDLLKECFEKVGRYVVSCHAKDLTWDVEMNIHFREVRPGTGALDYATYLRLLSKLPQRPPLMLEHLANAEEYTKAGQFILQLGAKEGLSFG